MLKRLGKAKYRVPEGGWFIEGQRGFFYTNDRLVDNSDEMKAFRRFARKIPSDTPPYREQEKRREFHEARDTRREKLGECIRAIYERLLEASAEWPILLREGKREGRRHQWNHCLYRAAIYRFTESGLDEDAMKEAIDRAESPSG